MRSLSCYISVNPEIQFGKLVFKGTRVPVESLFCHLEKGISLNEFLEDFPGVTKDQAEAVIEWRGKPANLPGFKNLAGFFNNLTIKSQKSIKRLITISKDFLVFY
jgi:uncharacterized protein (DUF433 family)